MLGRLEYQRGNYDAALQVFQGIDIVSLTPRMTRAVVERTRPLRKHRSKGEKADSVPPPGLMSLHSISLLLEAILLKAKSLEELGNCKGITFPSFHIMHRKLFIWNSVFKAVSVETFVMHDNLAKKNVFLMNVIWTIM